MLGSSNGVDCAQRLRFPAALEDEVDTTPPVRFLDGVGEQRERQTLGVTSATPHTTGRPSSPPGARRPLDRDGSFPKRRARRTLAPETPRPRALRW